jgi:hypothetical protein
LHARYSLVVKFGNLLYDWWKLKYLQKENMITKSSPFQIL